MIYSQSCQYALRALIYLSAQPAGALTTVREISAHEGLPKQFLAKLLQALARAGVVGSLKGPGGGFALSQPPESVSLYQVVEAIDGTLRLDACVLGLAECSDAGRCGPCEHWAELRDSIKAYLDSTTVEDLRAHHLGVLAAAPIAGGLPET